MFEGGSFIVLVGAGVLLLRPRDFPLLARGAGRLLGATVRSLRMAKQAAEQMVAENMQHANDPSSEMGRVGQGLRESLTKFDSLAATLKKDMSDVPINPRTLIRKGIRSMDVTTPKRSQEVVSDWETNSAQAQERTRTDSRQSDEGTTQKTHSGARIRKSIVVGERGNSCGVDFITRSIEEAALAKQKQQIFGGQAHSVTDHHETVVDESTRSET